LFSYRKNKKKRNSFAILFKNYKLFLKIKYNNKPVNDANRPLSHPNVEDNIEDSCSHDRTANIIPKAEMKSQISFNNELFIIINLESIFY
jgi:hypothetical protein